MKIEIHEPNGHVYTLNLSKEELCETLPDIVHDLAQQQAGEGDGCRKAPDESDNLPTDSSDSNIRTNNEIASGGIIYL